MTLKYLQLEDIPMKILLMVSYTFSYDDEGAEADFTNLETVFEKQRRNNHKDFHHCLFACFLSQHEPKKISEALEDKSWVDAMQEELLQFEIQKVWILVDLPYGKKAIGTKWVYRNKKDERGVVVRNKARLVAQGHRQEESYQLDLKSAFLYGKIDEGYKRLNHQCLHLTLESYHISDYAGENLDRKSTTGGCQFLGRRLITWQCKKQTIVATSTTEAEYVAAAMAAVGKIQYIIRRQSILLLGTTSYEMLMRRNSYSGSSVDERGKTHHGKSNLFQETPKPLCSTFLPTDVKHCLNVGYTFVNFTTSEAVWWKSHVCITRKSWPLFKSKKIAQVVFELGSD
ncbi:putative ribonuclease H-like domain-containing protein [Tanacetum coccineum]